eukprot:jgi/Tetstr1/462802/TSEL_007752.t1
MVFLVATAPSASCLGTSKVSEALSHVCVGRAEAGRFPFLYSPLLSSPGERYCAAGNNPAGLSASVHSPLPSVTSQVLNHRAFPPRYSHACAKVDATPSTAESV